MSTVYTVGFGDGGFLMVYNRRRGGWEMPGGRIESMESVEEAAVREFIEESGYEVGIVAVRELDDCWVCAGILGENKGGGEMASALFKSLPDELSFSAAEYGDVIAWAEDAVRRRGGDTKATLRTA